MTDLVETDGYGRLIKPVKQWQAKDELEQAKARDKLVGIYSFHRYGHSVHADYNLEFELWKGFE